MNYTTFDYHVDVKNESYEMRNNPNITQQRLSLIIGIGKSAIENNIAYLREHGFIERIGSKKNGYWQVRRNE